jgi:biotin carboxylase
LLLLFATTGYAADDFVAAARTLGVPYVFGTDRCHVMDDPWGDGALPVRFEDPDGGVRTILDYAATHPIRGIVAVGDRPTVVAARASQALGLLHNPPEAAEASRNKFLARQRFRAAGLRVPPFARYRIDLDPDAILRSGEPPNGRDQRLRRRCPERPNVFPGFPCVLKPLSLSASRGVIRADDPAQFAAAFRRVGALLRMPEIRVLRDEANDWILVEGFIPGREVALEGLLDGGRLRTLALFDKPDPLDGPFFEETIYVTPSRLSAATQEAIERCAVAAARALGLVTGPIHAELRVNGEGPWVLEVAARAIGGLCSRALRFGTGMSLEELIIRHAFGMDAAPIRREEAAAGVMMIPIPRGGVFRGVEGVEAASAVPGIEQVTITAKRDRPVVPLPEGSSYLGFIFARGPSPAEVEAALGKAHAHLTFDIRPAFRVSR